MRLFSAVAVLLLGAFASHASPSQTLAHRFQPRSYFVGAQEVPVGSARDVLVLRAAPATDPRELARTAEAAAAKVTAGEPGALGVVGARRIRNHGLFLVELMDNVPERTLLAMAEALSAHPSVQGVYPALTRMQGRAFYDHRVVLTAQPGQLEAVMGAALSKVEGTFVRHTRVADTVVIAAGAAAHADAVEAGAMLQGMPGVLSAEPELYREYELTATVDDPMHGDQWHLHRPGANQPVPGVGQIFVHGAWDTTKGDPAVRIAIFDSGMDTQHEDLLPNLVGQFDPSGADENAQAECSASADGAGEAPSCPADAPYRESHGTAVAGTAAGKGDNGLGISGVCPNCSIVAVRLLGEQVGSGLSTAESFVRAVDEGAWVINNSWGPGRSRYFPLSMAERTAFEHARTDGRDGKGTVIVFAAGNSTARVSSDPYASHPFVIAVAASTCLDDWAVYSNYGDEVDVAAPSLGGVVREDNHGIVTADVSGADGYDTSSYTTDFSGTSAASPVVAGVAGLILSANASLTAEQVRLILTSTADKIVADKVPWQDVIGDDIETIFAYDENGHSIGFGYGRVNATAAVAAALNPPAAGAACPSASCANCMNNRCQPACTTQEDCLDGSLCVMGSCTLPTNSSTQVGQPCNADCEHCTTALDTEGFAQSICTLACTADADCPVGFDCRITDSAGTGVCAVGNRSAGDRNNGTNCRSDLFGSSLVTGNAFDQTFCTDTCFSDEPGSCPYGWHCGIARCTCTSTSMFGGCRTYDCTEGGGSWTTDLCFPDLDYGILCDEDLDCARGSYCAGDDRCRPDDRQGCDLCTTCESDADCNTGESCFRASFQNPTGVCTLGCDGEESQCPGDSVCRDVARRNTTVKLCVAPGNSPNVPCTSNFTCTVACREDVPCADGQVCQEGACVAGPPDAGVPDSGAPDAASAGSPGDTGGGSSSSSSGVRVAGCNCQAPTNLSAYPGLFALVALVFLRRRR
jgi:subtilisin family serine protease